MAHRSHLHCSSSTSWHFWIFFWIFFYLFFLNFFFNFFYLFFLNFFLNFFLFIFFKFFFNFFYLFFLNFFFNFFLFILITRQINVSPRWCCVAQLIDKMPLNPLKSLQRPNVDVLTNKKTSFVFTRRLRNCGGPPDPLSSEKSGQTCAVSIDLHDTKTGAANEKSASVQLDHLKAGEKHSVDDLRCRNPLFKSRWRWIIKRFAARTRVAGSVISPEKLVNF